MFASTLFALNAFAGEQMSNDEMKAFYTGKTLSTIHHKKGIGKTFFGSDGNVESIKGDRNKTHGKWWVDEYKNMRCIRWDNKDKDLCRYTEKNDDGTHSLIRPKDGKHVVEFTASADGNQL